MTTLRLFAVLCCLTTGLAAAHAQSLLTRNTAASPTDPETAVTSPRKVKATESPVYVKVYGFYGLLTPGSQFRISLTRNMSGAPTSYKVESRSLGAGPRAGVGVGLIVSDFINLGIDADMLFGEKLSTEENYIGSDYTDMSTNYVKFRVLSIMPNITFKALSRPSFYIYNRLGIVGGVVLDFVNYSNSVRTSAGLSNSYNFQTDYRKNTLALGYQAALGIQFRISQGLRGFAEVVGYNQSFQPKESFSTSLVSYGGGDPSPGYFQTTYKKKGEYSSTQVGDVFMDEQPRENMAMNSIGLSLGLVFRF